MSEEKNGQANCFACRHFYITYEPQFPYGCRIMEFKSKQPPYLAVYTSSGIACQSFAPKKTRK